MGRQFAAAAAEVVVRCLAGVQIVLGIAAAEATERSLEVVMDLVVLSHLNYLLCYLDCHRDSVVAVVVDQRCWVQ